MDVKGFADELLRALADTELFERRKDGCGPGERDVRLR